MNRLNTQLKKLKRKSTPSKAFSQTLKSELSAEFDRLHPAAGWNWRRAFAAPVALSVVFLTMGMGTYTYASPDVNSEHALYPVKQAMENVESGFYTTPEGRARFHARMMYRRLEEAEVLQRKHKIMFEHLRHVAQELDLTIDNVQELKEDPELRQEIWSQVDKQTLRYQYLIISALDAQVSEEGVTKADLRNTLQHIRVKVDESDLTQEEKETLYQHIKPGLLELRQEFRERLDEGSTNLEGESATSTLDSADSDQATASGQESTTSEGSTTNLRTNVQ